MRAGQTVAAPYEADASKRSRLAGIASIILGPGRIWLADTEDESTAIDEITAGARIYANVALGLSRVG